MDEGKFTAEIYRQRALSLRHTAKMAVDEATRLDLLRLAESWERLAGRKVDMPPLAPSLDETRREH